MLTNHDMDSTSPFSCLLVGQPTLRRRMKMGALAALDQRIGLRYAMPPMQALVAAFAEEKAIVDESFARIAATEVTAE
jgi:type II secretory pathway predicted ATPase ExeA